MVDGKQKQAQLLQLFFEATQAGEISPAEKIKLKGNFLIKYRNVDDSRSKNNDFLRRI